MPCQCEALRDGTGPSLTRRRTRTVDSLFIQGDAEVLTNRGELPGQLKPDRVRAVLPRATTSPEERVQTVSNAARAWGVKLLQRRQNSEDAANACERRYRLDKLGVTGSSPVPPTSETPASPGVFVSLRRKKTTFDGQ